MLAGIDVGSTGMKVSIFSNSGRRLCYAYREYTLTYLRAGQVVFDPECWWDNLCACLRELSAQCDLRQLQGLAISHANAIILTDEQLKPVCKAIMQLDKRGSSMVPVLERELGGEQVFAVTGNNIADGYVWGPTLKWLLVNQPSEYARVRYLFNPTSYLVMRLTGVYCMDHTRAATTMLYDIHKGRWDETLCRYFSLRPEQMPMLCTSSEVVGHTLETFDAALPTGIPVAAGAMDTMAAVVGLGSGRQENALIMGSVGRFVLSPNRLDRRFLNTVMPDRSTAASMTPVNNAGTAVRWVRNLLFSRRIPGESCYEELDRLAAEKEPGAEGLMFFPYLNGSSCPNWDSSVRGAYFHVEAFHDAGHFARAVLEGVGYTLAESFQILRDQVGIRESPIYCGGGGAKSTVWTQILADIFQEELIVPENIETETIGCAILAGQGIQLLSPQDLRSWNGAARVVTPNPACAQVYQERLRQFISAYSTVREASKTK